MLRRPIATAALAVLAALAASSPTAIAAPSCAEGPQIVGRTYYGTPCDDTIRAPRSVTVVHGEGGDDTIYGQRGNDSLYGDAGNDRLYGGVGDDRLRGGAGDDLLSGGFGADNLDGENGSDLARGDATIDAIFDTGPPGIDVDTLSYATGATPGFFNSSENVEYPNFSVFDGLPPDVEGRGAYINLGDGRGDNGLAPAGGGVDEEVGGESGESFEVVIGTAFPDYIVGTEAPETFYGGGGADVILGEGGEDTAFGGAEGDYCDAAVTESCEFADADTEVEPRDPSEVDAGLMAPGAAAPPALYLTGSDEDDTVVATYSPEEPPEGQPVVSFTVNGGAPEKFELGEPPDSVLIAGLAGDDALTATGFPATTSVVLLGGEGGDDLTGGETEDALVDGAGDDTVSAGGRDDAVPNNGGADDLHAGSGEDLFISAAVCEGDTLDGGPDRDNANWANFKEAVSIDMGAQTAELVGGPGCGSDPPTHLEAIEDVEGTSSGDVLIGDSGDNQLLGRPGPDVYAAAGGNDSILANSGDSDLAIDCGSGYDTALIDIPTESYSDPTPVECEDVEERLPNSFRPPGIPPDPNPEPETASLVPVRLLTRDRTPPRTRILHRPGRIVFTRSRWRRVVFAFGSSEPGAHFFCRLDRSRFRRCGRLRAYRLRAGRHALRVFAVDRAGNRDRSPAQFRFAVRRLSVHSSRSHRRHGRTG